MNKNSQSSCCNNLYPGYEGCPNEIMSTKHRILCTKYHQTGIRGSKAFKHSQSVSCEDNNTCRAYWHHRTPVIHYRTPRSSNPSLKWVTDYEYYAGYYYCVTGEIDCRHCGMCIMQESLDVCTSWDFCLHALWECCHGRTEKITGRSTNQHEL